LITTDDYDYLMSDNKSKRFAHLQMHFVLPSAGFRGRARDPGPGPPTMFMCLAT